MRQVAFADGEKVPALGLGTWHMGERRLDRTKEVKALQLGLDLGMTLVDTAEMYGEGGAEEVVGEAIAGRRDRVFLVSKVYPHNASRAGAVAACERSLKRLGTDRLDLYLLHWRGSVPLAETIAGFEELVKASKIRRWGVSNFDAADIKRLSALAGGGACASNQVLYHLGERGIEWELLPDARRRKMPIMAYSPLGQGEFLVSPALKRVADKHGVKSAAVALAWAMRDGATIAIPKSSDQNHTRFNAVAADLVLDAADLAALDEAFAPPDGPSPLAVL
jgi:diketogulonate reductase-like aldo/keto reductase